MFRLIRRLIRLIFSLLNPFRIISLLTTGFFLYRLFLRYQLISSFLEWIPF